MQRRQLLKAAALAAAPSLIGGRLLAAPSAGGRLLVVFLRGAYDCASVLAPVDSPFYHEARPTIAIPAPDPLNPNAAMALGGGWGLHPALKDPLAPLWERGELAFIPFAGTDDLSRSHFETQNAIERGSPSGMGPSSGFSSGFMARLNHVLGGVRPIAFTDQLPLIFQGEGPVPNMAVNVNGKPGVDERQAKLIQGMYRRTGLGGAVKEGFEVRDEVYRSVALEMAKADRGAPSPRGFELSARRIARLMKSDYNLGFVDVGGWDTHVNQGAASGYLAGRLSELGRGLAAYAEELGPDAWRSSVVMVVSEFGRTFRENGDKGTDHGHGSVYWALGGGVKGGRVLGRTVEVTPAGLNQNRDYPVLNEYRAVFAGLFRGLYGLSRDRLGEVFPGVEPLDLQIV